MFGCKELIIGYIIAVSIIILFFVGAGSNRTPRQKDDDDNPSVEG